MARPRKRTFPATKPATPDAVVAAQVAYLRTSRGWSQARLATELGQGYTTNVVQRLETGDRRITVEELLRLAYALDVSPSDLVAASFAEVDDVPLFKGHTAAREDVRAWMAGERSVVLDGMDERRYREQIGPLDYLARTRVRGLEDIQATVNELRNAGARGTEDAIDDCLRALEAQVKHVRRRFGRSRGSATMRARGSGRAEVTRARRSEHS